MIWRGRNFEFSFPRPALVMGVLNVTPDSFSDGGLYLEPAAAVAHGLDLVRQGADILDIGGESTRPQAAPVDAGEELRRVLSVIPELAGQTKVPLSIDTQKPVVARAALEAGAAIVNDVAANRTGSEMWDVIAGAEAGYVAVHMQGTPQMMQDNPVYADVVAEVDAFFGDRLDRLAAAGVAPDQVALDVGIGFGKSVEHNLQLLGGLRRFTRWHRPLLLGVSRKSFIGKLLGVEVTSRLPGALACACHAVAAGASIIRTHDVAETCQALRMTEAIRAHEK
jgi:dihydropteroate synthase